MAIDTNRLYGGPPESIREEQMRLQYERMNLNIQSVLTKCDDILLKLNSLDNKPQLTDEYMTTVELCSYLKISQRQVSIAIKEYNLPYKQLMGKAYRFNRAEVDRWLNDGGKEMLEEK